MLRRPALFLILVAAKALASGEEAPTWHLSAQLYSFHEHTGATELHNTTPGLGVMRREDDWLAGAGVFRNSIDRWAGYGYVGWQYPFRYARVGGIAGITHHYYLNGGGIVPLAAAVVTVPLARRLAMDFVAIPRVRGVTYATLNLSLSWQLR